MLFLLWLVHSFYKLNKLKNDINIHIFSISIFRDTKFEDRISNVFCYKMQENF